MKRPLKVIGRREAFSQAAKTLAALAVTSDILPGPWTAPAECIFSTDGRRSFEKLMFWPPGHPDVPANALTIGDFGSWTIKYLHRDEFITEDRHGPQPTPLSTSVSHHELGREPGGEPITLIIREWEPGAPAHCRLCAKCQADPPKKPGDTARCAFGVPGVVDETDAPLYRFAGWGTRT